MKGPMLDAALSHQTPGGFQYRPNSVRISLLVPASLLAHTKL